MIKLSVPLENGETPCFFGSKRCGLWELTPVPGQVCSKLSWLEALGKLNGEEGGFYVDLYEKVSTTEGATRWIDLW